MQIKVAIMAKIHIAVAIANDEICVTAKVDGGDDEKQNFNK